MGQPQSHTSSSPCACTDHVFLIIQAHLINCSPMTSHSALLGLIRDYLAVTKAGGKQPRSVLEKKMFALKQKHGEQVDLTGMDEPVDVVMSVDGTKLGKGKGRAVSRAPSTASSNDRGSRRMASGPPLDHTDEPTKSPSPFRSLSPEPIDSADHAPSASTMSQPTNPFATFAYPGGRSLSRVNSTGSAGIRAPTRKESVPECPIRDIEMRKIKKCLFCETDWSAPGKKTLVRVKWVRLTPSSSGGASLKH